MPKYAQITWLFVALTVLVALSAQAQTQQRGPSTPEERTRAVQTAKSLRTDPLATTTQGDREWLIKWLIEIPDISVKLCSNFLGDLGKSENGYSGAIIASMMASEVSFIIEHPDKTKDSDAVYFAGVEGALDSYQAIQKKELNYHLPHLDELVQKREQGKLKEYVHTTAKTCKRNG